MCVLLVPRDQRIIAAVTLSRALGPALVLLATSASAHDTWLAATAHVEPRSLLRMELTSGGAFPDLESPIQPERLVTSACRIGGADVAMGVGPSWQYALRLRAWMAAPGIAVCRVALGPRALELEPAEVAHYLDEIGAQAAVGPLWAKVPEPRRWRETYTKHAKAVVRVGDTAEESWREPVGLGLEVVPLADPTRLKAGTALPVRVLKAGQALAGLPLRAVTRGRPPVLVTTDAAGEATIALPAAGPWLIAGTELRPSAARPGEWESDFTTLTLDVAP
jgi:uncharacterized GH25 family protein